MSAQPGTPPPAQRRTQQDPHSDVLSATEQGSKSSVKKSSRKAKNKAAAQLATPSKDNVGHVSDSPAYGARTGNATRPKTTRQFTPRHSSRGSNGIPISQMDGTIGRGTDVTIPPNGSPASFQYGANAQQQPAIAASTAYAGPTFHASPAPSKLPMPKFYSKSVPSHLPDGNLESRADAEESVPATPEPSTRAMPPFSSESINREQSPLDFFFNAHRNEQARQRSSNAGPWSPPPSNPAQSDSPSRPKVGTSRSVSYTAQPNGAWEERTPQKQMAKSSDKQMFMMELDGNGGYDESDEAPASVPFQDRIKSASRGSARNAENRNTKDDELWRQTQTQALKKLLMAQPQPSSPLSRQESSPSRVGHSTEPFGNFDSPSRQGNAKTSNSQATFKPDLASMENDLKRMLKLGP